MLDLSHSLAYYVAPLKCMRLIIIVSGKCERESSPTCTLIITIEANHFKCNHKDAGWTTCRLWLLLVFNAVLYKCRESQESVV